jgi:hypothetical protein
MKNTQIFRCPSDSPPSSYGGGVGAVPPYLECSYGPNVTPLTSEAPGGLAVVGLCGRSMAIQERPAEKILWAETENWAASGVIAVPGWTGDPSVTSRLICRI